METPTRTALTLSRCLLLAFLLMAGTAAAQGLHITGTVRDAATGEPLVSAQVRVLGRMQGALTDARGAYDLTVDAGAKALEVSHIGYAKAQVPVGAAREQRLDVRLETAAALAPVVITAGPERVLEDKTIHLYDYDFIDDKLAMIVYDRAQRRSKLALVDGRDSIIDMVAGAEEPGRLERDCLGNVHAIGRQWACQLFVMDSTIGFYQDSLSAYKRVVEPCLGNVGSKYYFEYRYFNNQILYYAAYDMVAGQWATVLELSDANKMHQLMDPLGIYAPLIGSKAGMMALTEEDWEKVGKIDAEFQFQQMAFFYPIDAPLKVVDGQPVVFDHLNGKLHKLLEGGKEEQVAVTYHKEPHFVRSIVVDEPRGEAYALYEQHGYFRLRKIDLATGAVGEPVEIPRRFPHEIKVRDGVAYFMYRENEHDDTNRLYRMRL